MTNAAYPARPHALQGEAMLAAWERAAALPPPSRALALLAAAYPGLDAHGAAALDLPQRDLLLLALRRESFGEALDAYAECDACGERLEFSLPAARIAEMLAAARQSDGALARDGWSVQVRFAAMADVAAAAAEPDPAGCHAVLLDRCVSATDPQGRAVAAASLPPDLHAAALERLTRLHDEAELRVTLSCPACRMAQGILLDLPAFLWAELRHAAHRLLADVHELAWAYGWDEAAILRMGAARREAYLAMVRS